METIVRTEDLRRIVSAWRAAGERVAFVPTMGNLHNGHGNLVREASKLADRIVVSVFVNPMQFGPNEDFAAYPRTPDEDRRLLESLGADALFTPTVEEMYPRGDAISTRVQVPDLDGILCGEFRPGHFIGVATIVTKLLNLVQPDVALFGEKDYQQLMIIRRAATDLCMPMQIVGVPTTREPDGLAMSSRNRYLSVDERQQAPHIFAALETARTAIESGSTNFAALEQAGVDSLKGSGFRPDYFAIRDAFTLGAPAAGNELVILTAARIGRARLIDNVRANSPRR